MIYKIYVNLKENSYWINIEYNLLRKIKSLKIKRKKKLVIITNNLINKLHIEYLYSSLKKMKYNFDKIILPDGEYTKSLKFLNEIFTNLLNKSYGKNIILLAFGGGVIGDITGFAASIYHRGINFIQIPTTLLSQVDSSIGGKTGINHSLGKNMIGSIHQPISVLIDPYILLTLNKREFSSGLAEVIKYGIILDKYFFNWLELNIEKLINLDKKTLLYCIYKCCLLKTKIISLDEKELNIRSILNLGHTYGHAIEAYMGYGNWLHGEAISFGIILASNIAIKINNFPISEFIRIKNLLLKAELPITGPKFMLPEDYIKYMIKDKKNRSKNIRLILPTKIGKVKIYDNITNNEILNSIKDFYERNN